MKRVTGIGMLLPILMLSACATNSAVKAPDANLSKLKTFYVVRVPEDECGIEKLIAARLTAIGYQSTSGDASGGKETSSMGASQISDEAFAQALRDSIEKSGLFAKVSPSGARYKLTGFIGKVDQPLIGLSLTVKMEVNYSLVDTQSGTTVWAKDIASEYTAMTGEAFAAVKRLRLANEGAARENIQQAIAAMAALKL